MRRPAIILFLVLISNSAFSQKPNVEYRTYSEDSIGLHYLTFLKDGKCRIRFPDLQTHPNAMLHTKAIFFIEYETKNDTISFLKVFRLGCNSILVPEACSKSMGDSEKWGFI